MKRIAILFLSLFMIFSQKSVGQTTIPLPNSSFENWSTGNGYSVTVFFFSLPVYDSYTYPTDWNYPTYPVNEDLTYSGMNVNVNTDLPLLKVVDVTTGVPNGSHAIGLQSFMVSDIINPTVYNLAAASFDSAIVSSVFPTVLSTGAVNTDNLMPMVDELTSQYDSLSSPLTLFADMDLDSLIDGGIPLNGAVPGRLTGYYRYTSAIGGDRGGVLMLGSKYNPATQRREVVGGGYTTELTDVDSFTSFEVPYTPLSEIDSTAEYVEPDSLVLMLISSATTEPQQGSTLYLDHLQLWMAGVDPVEDTCSAIFNLTVNSVDTTHAELSWTYEGVSNHFEAEYGLQGFEQGTGTLVTVGTNTLSLSGLTPDTNYDVYVHCVCGATLEGDWAMVSFHTDTLSVIPEDTTHTEDTTVVDTTGIQIFTTQPLTIYPNPAHGQCVVQFEQELPSAVRLYGQNGQLLIETVPTKETMELELPAAGVYLLVCEMKAGVVTRRIISQGK